MLDQSIFTKIRSTRVTRCKHLLGNYIFLHAAENVSDIILEQKSNKVAKLIRESY